MDDIQVIDNFLSDEEHQFIKNIMLDQNFPWYYFQSKVYPGKNENLNDFQFVHAFSDENGIKSPMYFNIIMSLLKNLPASSLLRVKANLTTHTDENILSEWHVDTKTDKFKTAVYYVNSNNGKTIFKNGREVESVENRIVIFDGKLEHAGTTSTNTKVRCVINLNYIEN